MTYYAYHGDHRGNRIATRHPEHPDKLAVILEADHHAWTLTINGPKTETHTKLGNVDETYLHTAIQHLAAALTNITRCRCANKQGFNTITQELAATNILPTCPNNCPTCRHDSDAWSQTWENTP